jgi:hypothetical protein
MAPRLLHYQQKGQNLIIEDGNNNEIIWKVMMPMAVFGLKTPFIAAISSGITDENESVKATLPFCTRHTN